MLVAAGKHYDAHNNHQPCRHQSQYGDAYDEDSARPALSRVGSAKSLSITISLHLIRQLRADKAWPCHHRPVRYPPDILFRQY